MKSNEDMNISPCPFLIDERAALDKKPRFFYRKSVLRNYSKILKNLKVFGLFSLLTKFSYGHFKTREVCSQSVLIMLIYGYPSSKMKLFWFQEIFFSKILIS